MRHIVASVSLIHDQFKDAVGLFILLISRLSHQELLKRVVISITCDNLPHCDFIRSMQIIMRFLT